MKSQTLSTIFLSLLLCGCAAPCTDPQPATAYLENQSSQTVRLEIVLFRNEEPLQQFNRTLGPGETAEEPLDVPVSGPYVARITANGAEKAQAQQSFHRTCGGGGFGVVATEDGLTTSESVVH